MLQFWGWPHDPGGAPSLATITDAIEADALLLVGLGYDSVMLQNLGSRSPWRAESPHELAAMTALAARVRCALPAIRLGLNLPSDDPVATIAAAYGSGADFVRLKVFIGTMRRAEGTLDGCANAALDYRHRLDADRIEIWADVHDRTGDPVWPASFADGLREAEYAGGRTFVVTGKSTQATLAMLAEARSAVPDRTLIVGGGIDASNLRAILDLADGVIVGSALHDPSVPHRIDRDRAGRLIDAAQSG
jgi:membrane complex biogenesis BtpA family protein